MTSTAGEITMGPHDRRWYARPVVWVFLLSLAIRGIWAGWACVTPISDYMAYDLTGEYWLKTGEYHYSGGTILAYRPPGYPGFLAAIYAFSGPGAAGWKAAGLVQALLGAVSSALLVVLAGRAVSPRVGLIAGLLHALWPTAIVYVPVLASENVAVLLLIMGLLCLRATGAGGARGAVWAAVAGLVYGFMLLVRPVSLFLLPAWLLLTGCGPQLRRPRFLPVVLCLVGASIPVVPWLVRNYRLGFGPITLSTQGGYSLWWGNNPRTRDGGSGGPPRFPGDKELSEIEQHHFFMQKALQWIAANPGRYAALSGTRVLRFLGTEPDHWAVKYFWPTKAHDAAVTARYASSRRHPADPDKVAEARVYERRNSNIHAWFLVFAAPLTLVALVFSGWRWRTYALFLIPFVFYLAGLSLTCFAPRYRVVSDPLLFVPLAALLADILTGSADLTPRPWRLVKLAVCVVAIAASVALHVYGWDQRLFQLSPMPAAPTASVSAADARVATSTTPSLGRWAGWGSGASRGERPPALILDGTRGGQAL